jgi:hypothetical protein
MCWAIVYLGQFLKKGFHPIEVVLFPSFTFQLQLHTIANCNSSTSDVGGSLLPRLRE